MSEDLREPDNEESEEEQNEETVLTVNNVDSLIDTLNENVIETVKRRGFYRVFFSEVDKKDEEGQIVEVEEDEGKEIVQWVKQIAANGDIFDMKKKRLVNADEKGIVHDIVFYDGYDTIYYGDVTCFSYKDSLSNNRYVIVPHGKGRIYKNGKCVCAGYFNDGKKKSVISYKENGVAFLHDYKGGEDFKKHNRNDLLVSMENDELDKKKALNDDNYENVIKYSLNRNRLIDKKDKKKDLTHVNNLTIRIDNGYEFNFDRKSSDYVSKEGEVTAFPAADKEKMYINVDKIVDDIISIVNRCGGTLRVIEIVGMNNFGFLKDKNGQDLIDLINVRLRPILYNRDIKLFIQNVDENAFVDRVSNKYNSGEKQNTVIASNMTYSSIDTETGQRIYYNTKDEYEADLKDNDYYINVLEKEEEENEEQQEQKKTKSLQDTDIVLWDVVVDKDNVLKMRQQQEKELKKKIDEVTKKNIDLSKSKQPIIDNNTCTEGRVSGHQLLVCCIAAIVLPIIGFWLVYYFWKYQMSKNNYSKSSKPIKNSNEGLISKEDRQGQKQESQGK